MNKIKFYYLFLLIFVVNCDKLFPEDNEGPRISIIKPSDFDKVNESVEILALSPNYDIPKVNFAISRVEPNLISLGKYQGIDHSKQMGVCVLRFSLEI